MTAERFEAVKTIFHAARELPPQERTAFLANACADDEQLRREVNDLLASDRAMDGFMADAPAALALELLGRGEENPDVGRIIGQYRLIACIGSGGMGTVYLAERADQQFQMQVALKVIKRGMDTDAVLRRFQHERQILASLEHPNIARLLDGGTTEDGLPYFVMEYIRGERIDRYADEHELPVAERLASFRQVCGAVSYAHQHLVVHRDLKPSNILVTSDGTPKLLDFGIAKIIQPNDSAQSLATMTFSGAMTPQYASPEQIEGAPATTLSDVYSLGAVLYELLGGRPPYELPNRSPQALAKAIETGILEKPSAIVRRAEDARRLRGDLDNIVLMAMQKETARRYRSVEQFSEDIRRHLAGLPVLARADTLSYRTGKFLQRNKLAVAAAALVLLSLVAGIIATTWQAHIATREKARAERRFAEVRKLAHSVLFDYHDSIKALPGATKVREQLVKDALGYLDSLAAEAQGDPALQRELAAGYERVGDVRGGQRGANLGDTAGAIDSYTKALRIREGLVARQPRDAESRRELAGAHSDLGVCLMNNEPQAGVKHLQQARALLLQLTQEQPANDKLLDDLGDTSQVLGRALVKAGDLSGALEQYRAAASIAEKLVERNPHDKTFRLSQLVSERSLALALWQQQGDEAGATEVIDKALELIQGLIAEDRTNTNYQTGLFHLNNDAGKLRSETDPAAALPYFRRAAELAESSLQADPANSEAHVRLADAYMNIAHALSHEGDFAQALSCYSKAAEHYERYEQLVATATNRFGGVSLKVVTARAGAAAMRARSGASEVALEECSKLAARLREIPDDPTNISFRLFRAEAYEFLGYAYRDIALQASASERKQHLTVARDMLRQSADIFEDVRTRGGLDVPDAKEAKSVSAEIAKCDAALNG